MTESYREPGVCGACGESMVHECPGPKERTGWLKALAFGGGFLTLLGGLAAWDHHVSQQPAFHHWAVASTPNDGLHTKRGVFVDDHGTVTIDGVNVTISGDLDIFQGDLRFENGGSLSVGGTVKGPGSIVFGTVEKDDVP